MFRPDEVHIRFYSLSGSKTTRPTPHLAAMLPSVHVFAPAGLHNDIKPTTAIIELCISGQYVIWELAVTGGEVHSCSVKVCNWTTGEVISVRTSPSSIRVCHRRPSDLIDFLTCSSSRNRSNRIWISVYTFSPSHHICTLRLSDPKPGERVVWHEAYTGDRPQTSEGHSRTDLSLSMVVLILGAEHEHETHLLIPRATFLAQIRQTDSSEPESVPWADWVRRDASGCSCGPRTPPAASS
ncbi:hypothetical protein LXA43DRAFT_540500 [Ganoderma leucocontextum]|nr:hypothetical protein LXA43DRAFT_540500 [Ganoderma leucocontextum]